MSKVTKQMLDKSLDAWQVAKEQALLEQLAMNTLIKNHGSLIDSLRKNGHTWSQSDAEFDELSKAHQEAVMNAWKNMDDRCRDYQKLKAQFNVS